MLFAGVPAKLYTSVRLENGNIVKIVSLLFIYFFRYLRLYTQVHDIKLEELLFFSIIMLCLV